MIKQNNVIHQVQISVTGEGQAVFHTEDGEKRTIRESHGWVPVATFFGGEAPEADSGSGKDEAPCSLDRARTSSTYHQFNTIPELANHQPNTLRATVRLQSYIPDEVLMETNK